jgi:Putative zinc-finger
MAMKSMHPETELFEYLNHSLPEEQSSAVESHLSTCDECASVVALVRALKSTRSLSDQQIESSSAQNHPPINELASFFYSPQESANLAHVARHIALCSLCAEAVAQYAHGEQASEMYKSTFATASEISAAAWRMIDDWENSSFGTLKPAKEVLNQELLNRLTQLFRERVEETTGSSSDAKTAQRVPVLVISSSGEVRSVEFFDRATDHTGASILRHSEGSARFDNRPIHVLFAFDERDPQVASTVMKRDTIRLDQTRAEAESRRANYFIIED